MARILLGVSGGIAAYKSLELARLATQAGHGVRVLMTESAGRFVGAASFEGIVGAPVLVSEFERDSLRGGFPGDPRPEHDPIGHLELAANCDACLVAPASANTLAKLAAGIADSMLTTSFLACAAPRLVAPAMNDRMYVDAATQASLATLRERGVIVIEPEEGALASRGEHGRGRLPDPARLLARLESVMPAGERPWDGLRVLVTAGGTREPIDPVRFIGNRSSGRMGIALAAAAARRGADVTLIAANVSLPEPAGVRRVDVGTTAELAEAARAEFATAHVLLMAAAPADFRAADPAGSKLQRQDGLSLDLEPTEDILAGLAASRREGQTIVAFAAETGENVDRARDKLQRKNADLIVLNDVSDPKIGFESPENAVTLIDSTTETPVAKASKDTIADAILNRVSSLREEGRQSPRAGGYSKRRADYGSAGVQEGIAAPPTTRPGYTRCKLFRYRCVREVGLAHFFFGPNSQEPRMKDLQADIQQQLSELDSELDLVALEQPGGETLRLFIDHPGGVDLALCERVTLHLNHLRADYALEVSSPGPKYRRPESPATEKEQP